MGDISMAKRSICASVFSACLCFIAVALQQSACTGQRPAATVTETENGMVLYVSPNGKDTWSGFLASPKSDGSDGPVATLAGARDAVRALRKQRGGLSQPVRIEFAEGTYSISEPVIFTPEDSGAAGAPVTYAAAPGAKPVISGGRAIEGWTPGQDNMLTAKIADPKWRFRQLFANGQRYTRARTPNREDYWHKSEEGSKPALADGVGSFQFRKGDVLPWPQADSIEIVFHRVWDTSRHHVISVDREKSLISFRVPKNLRRLTHWGGGSPYWLENSLAFCDSPGEWFLDSEKGILYLRPLKKHANGELTVVAPVVESLIKFEGRQNQPIKHITFRGLSFQHADWSLADEGYNGHQADVEVGANIEGDFVESVTFEKCAFSHLGRYAVWFRKGCKGNVVSGCEFSDLGTGAVQIGENSTQSSQAFETSHHKVVGCHIYDDGQVFPSGVGIWVGFSGNNLIADNHIHDTTGIGISVGWGWADRPNAAHDNIIERNYIHDIENIMGDGAGIYTLGRQPGTIIRDNVIHDVNGFISQGTGIYLDNGSADITIENNLIARTIGWSFVNNTGGGRNILRNNIFALPGIQVFSISRNIQKTIEENVIYIKEGFISEDKPKDSWDYTKVPVFRNNLYFSAGAPLEFPGGRTLEQWRKLGQDEGSMIADPGFVDVAKGDFNLKPGSPALKVGFKPFKVPIIGPARPDRRDDPRLVKLFALKARVAASKPRTP